MAGVELATIPTEDPETFIEVDNTIDDDESAISSRVSAFTESLSSSVVDFRFKHGRRYHNFRDGAYPFPNDEPELERLDLTHQMMYLGIGRKYYLAPIEADKVKRILDLGTGTGIWSIVIADEFPDAQIIGNDLSPVQSPWVPPNVKFEVDDVESPWVYDYKFDYIFCRYMTACIQDWPKLAKNAYDNLNPGGWVEFQDFDFHFYSEDRSLTPTHAVSKWLDALHEAGDKTGRPLSPGPLLEGFVRGAGFQNVHHRRFKFPLGPWPRDPAYKEVGLYNITQFEDGVEGFSLALLVGVLGWSLEEVKAIVAEVKKDTRDPRIHIQFDLHVVYGQKPSV